MKQLKNLWVCVGRKDNYDYTSVHSNEKDSIKEFLKYSPEMSWEECQKQGWRCVLVNITFEEVKK